MSLRVAGGCPCPGTMVHAAAGEQARLQIAGELLGLILCLVWRAEPPLKEPTAARSNILSAAAAEKAMPGGGDSHSASAQGILAPTDARPATAQPARSGAGPAHVGLHVSNSSLTLPGA